MSENEANESNQVERMLMKFEEIPNRDRLVVNVFSIEIESVGCWIVKFRKTGVIVNNRDLILSIIPDASIIFKSFASFVRTMDGGSTLSDEMNKGQLNMTGPTEALDSFRSKWLRVCDLPNTAQAEVPSRPARLPSLDKVQPLKAGWLLKKRDIFSGWRCRYFVVYPDRLEYFIDQYDATPKATLSLIDVEIQPVKRVNMQGVGEHWGIIVTTKNPKSTFRLASEMTGIEGMIECSTWEKVFSIARQSCEQYLDTIVTDSELSKQKRFNEQQAAQDAAIKLSAQLSPSKDTASSNSKFSLKNLLPRVKAYVFSKQGAPKVLLGVGLTVLLIRVAWNVSRLQQVFRNVLFHSSVAVLILTALFFLKSIFTEYFTSDEVDGVDDTSKMNTIAPPNASPKAASVTATAASTMNNNNSAKLGLQIPSETPKTTRKRLFNFSRNRNSTQSAQDNSAKYSAQDKASNPKPGAQDNTSRHVSPVRRLSTEGPKYGGVSPLPPHVISTKQSAGMAEHPMNTNTMKNVTNSSSDDS
eukprot:CAMPEP_0184969754 /NCGR_PEP_ID=MMETSP1098-20130426/2429_1 /TAXON_ID=89044 /ORGANISM="Spumella elongata, Strain CCAP 955/1" /LENGTH=526 /DNA_ID=CAMNT_0027491567 /DNA_START=109 /DNA_END=1689 /DNA_ORIENTATION=+